VAALATSLGLEVSALSLFTAFTEPATRHGQVAAACEFIGLAPRFDTNVVKLTPGAPASRGAAQAHWDSLAAALEPLCDAASEAGVRLAFETHMRQLTDTLAGARRLMDMAPADVGLTVDFSNLRFAGEDLGAAIPLLAPRMYNAHVKNGVIGPDGAWRFLPLDQGLTDYAQVVPQLRDLGYDGYLAVECLGPDARTAPRETAARDLALLRRWVPEA
jgi:sugar phosphate isomerase/epimerase